MEEDSCLLCQTEVLTIEGKLRCAYWKILTCAKKIVIAWEYDAEVEDLGCMKNFVWLWGGMMKKKKCQREGEFIS